MTGDERLIAALRADNEALRDQIRNSHVWMVAKLEDDLKARDKLLERARRDQISARAQAHVATLALTRRQSQVEQLEIKCAALRKTLERTQSRLEGSKKTIKRLQQKKDAWRCGRRILGEIEHDAR